MSAMEDSAELRLLRNSFYLHLFEQCQTEAGELQ
jgi:hypothetical protein